MSIPQELVNDLLVKCGRRCCICRRFEPLHLQVHHIMPLSEEGTNDSDNLIAICLTCHSDVHAKTALSRRFTVQELKGHRDTLFKLVAEGKLTEGLSSEQDYDNLLQNIIEHLRSGFSPAVPREMISADAVQLLLAAVKADGTIFDMSDVFTSSTTLGSVREMSKEKAALDELESYGLATWATGKLYRVTHSGFLLADEILAAAQEQSEPE